MRALALYGLNGLINTVVSYVVFVAAAQIIDYRLAIVVGYSVGILLSYLLNSRIVFRARGRLMRFVLVSLLLMACNVLLTWTLVATNDWAPAMAQLIAIPIVFLAGYCLNRMVVFDNARCSN